MTFNHFLNVSNYSATYAANCLLYQPDSRLAKLAKNIGYEPSEHELKKMRCLIAGKGSFSELFPSEPDSSGKSAA